MPNKKVIVMKVRRNYAWVESKAVHADYSSRRVGQGEIGLRLSSNWMRGRGLRVPASYPRQIKEAEREAVGSGNAEKPRHRRDSLRAPEQQHAGPSRSPHCR